MSLHRVHSFSNREIYKTLGISEILRYSKRQGLLQMEERYHSKRKSNKSTIARLSFANSNFAQHTGIFGLSGWGKSTFTSKFALDQYEFGRDRFITARQKPVKLVEIAAEDRIEIGFWNMPAHPVLGTSYYDMMQNFGIESKSYPTDVYTFMGTPPDENSYNLPDFMHPIYLNPADLSTDDYSMFMDLSDAQKEVLEQALRELTSKDDMSAFVDIVSSKEGTVETQYRQSYLPEDFPSIPTGTIKNQGVSVSKVRKKLEALGNSGIFSPVDYITPNEKVVHTLNKEFMFNCIQNWERPTCFHVPVFSNLETGEITDQVPMEFKRSLIRYILKLIQSIGNRKFPIVYILINDFGDLCRDVEFAKYIEFFLGRGRAMNVFIIANATLIPPKIPKTQTNTITDQLHRLVLFGFKDREGIKEMIWKAIPSSTRISPEGAWSKYAEGENPVIMQRYVCMVIDESPSKQIRYKIKKHFFPPTHLMVEDQRLTDAWKTWCDYQIEQGLRDPKNNGFRNNTNVRNRRWELDRVSAIKRIKMRESEEEE